MIPDLIIYLAAILATIVAIGYAVKLRISTSQSRALINRRISKIQNINLKVCQSAVSDLGKIAEVSRDLRLTIHPRAEARNIAIAQVFEKQVLKESMELLRHMSFRDTETYLRNTRDSFHYLITMPLSHFKNDREHFEEFIERYYCDIETFIGRQLTYGELGDINHAKKVIDELVKEYARTSSPD
jgi:hypothetical protein